MIIAMHRPPCFLFGLLLVVPFFLLGCGGRDEGPEVIPVKGQVTVNGEPLKGAGVSFRPDTERGNTAEYMPGGSTDEQGNYEIAAVANKKGAPPGWYKVVVMPPSAPPGSDIVIEYPDYNPKFMRPEETDLEIEVKATEDGEPMVYDIQLTE